jgi:hypothetical protein
VGSKDAGLCRDRIPLKWAQKRQDCKAEYMEVQRRNFHEIGGWQTSGGERSSSRWTEKVRDGRQKMRLSSVSICPRLVSDWRA